MAQPMRSKPGSSYRKFLQSKGHLPMDKEDMDSSAAQMMSEGGYVERDRMNPDVMTGEQEQYNSSGEPHTEDEFEDDKDMEYMFLGGRVPSEPELSGSREVDRSFVDTPHGSRDAEKKSMQAGIPDNASVSSEDEFARALKKKRLYRGY